MTRTEAERYRGAIVIASASLSDETASTVPDLFDAWETDTDYVAGDRRKFGGVLYKCLTAHRSQSTWTPDVSPSLWVRTDDPSIEFPPWVQPQGATDAYRLGAKVSHNDKHWISTIDYNTYAPGVYGWDEVT